MDKNNNLLVENGNETDLNPSALPGDEDNDLLFNRERFKKKRNAFRKVNVYNSRGHEFLAKYFMKPVYCSFCSESLWGFDKQGYECRLCLTTIHVKCFQKILTNCTTGKNEEPEKMKGRLNLNVPHSFQEKRFLKPKFCEHCGHLLSQFKKNFKCQICSFNCHKECERLVPNNCGINQKRMSEILDEIYEEKKNLEIEAIIKKEIDRVTMKKSKRFGSSSGPPSFKLNKLTDIIEDDDDYNVRSTKKINIKDFKLEKLLGQGAYGKVFLVSTKKKQGYYAMKVIKKDAVLQNDDVGSTMFERDVGKLGNDNPFLAKLYCTFQNPELLFFVMEFLNGGDLSFHYYESRFDETRARFYASEILCGLQFLHSNEIIYRDLKLDNVLLDSLGHCKISDFGMCKKIILPDGLASTFCGTPDYIAPEIIRYEKYNFSVDFWSFGVLLYEMLVGFSPFRGDDEDELFKSIQQHQVFYPKTLSEKSVSCLKQLFERNPQLRLGMATSPHGDIRNHPFFDSIDWEKLEKRQIEPPFKPRIRSPNDVSNFDPDYIFETPRLSQIDTRLVQTIDDEIFKKFSFVNKEFKF